MPNTAKDPAESRVGVKLSRWPVAIVGLILAAASGCCGGRLMSLQLYETDAPANAFPQQASQECRHSSLGFPGLRRLHGPPLTGVAGDHSFRGPAFGAPLPSFHPVPTRPVFEPRDDYGPLKLLEPDVHSVNASQAAPSPLSGQQSVLR